MTARSKTSSNAPYKITSTVQFQNFHPGQEYTKSIQFHNVSQSNGLIVKIQKLPKHSAFFLPGYRPGWKLRIRKGLKESIDIVFRPIEKLTSFEDKLEFIIYEDRSNSTDKRNKMIKDATKTFMSTNASSTRNNKLRSTGISAFDSIMSQSSSLREQVIDREIFTHCVKLRAVVPDLKFALSAPAVDFGYCAVRDQKTTQITLKRKSIYDDDLPPKVSFNWYTENESLFSITPKCGEIIGDEVQQFAVTFTPQEAMSVEATAVCCINDEENPSIILQMNGIGKYSFLTLSESCIDFSSVLTGQSVSKTFEICNKSLVGTNFSVHRLTNPNQQNAYSISSPFSFRPSSGYIDAEESKTIVVTYTPITNDLTDSEIFEVRSLDLNITNKRMIQCIGKSFGPKVSIVGSSIMNFGQVKVGQTLHQVLHLRNDSPISAEFEIIDGQMKNVIDTIQETPVQFKQTHAIIPPGSSLKISVSFSLSSPINYYQRYYIAVRNQKLSYIDILGNGFTDEETPAPLKVNHIFAYRERCLSGLELTTPEELDNLQQNRETLSSEEISTLSKFESSLSDFRTYTTYDQVLQEYFTASSSRSLNRPVSLDISSVSFGRATVGHLSNQMHIVRVKNNTNSKITCLPFVGNVSNGSVLSPFLIFPEEGQDILPKSSVEFKVAFRPAHANSFYHQTANFLCFYKIQRSFRLVSENAVSPPFSLPLKISGHTFSDSGSLALKAYLSPSRMITFPSLLVHETASQTIVLRNSSDIPLPFSIDITSGVQNSPIDMQGIFSVYPSEGQVEPNDFRLITFLFKPKKSQEYQCVANFTFNMSQQSKKSLTLIGNGCIPYIEAPQSVILLKPTHKGGISKKTFQLRNPTMIPVSMRLNLDSDLSKVLSLRPKETQLPPNTTIDIEAEFTPQTFGSFTASATCEILTNGLTVSEASENLSLTFVGEVANGSCEIEPSHIDFKDVRVGDAISSQITLLNSGEVDLPYELVFYNRDENGDLVLEPSSDIQCPDKHLKRGSIPARSYVVIPIIFQPKQRRYSRIAAICCLPLEIHDSIQKSRDYSLEQIDRFPTCELEGVGCLPQLGITDIYSTSIAKNNLWSMFSIDQINDELSIVPQPLPPSAKEIAFSSFIKYMKRFIFDFGTKTIGNEDTTIFLQIENIGKIDAEYSFMFSNDPVIDVDRWAENEDQRTEEEEKELFIILNNIFTISPKNGRLQPGERSIVQLTYRHKLADVHSVPLWMKVHNGGTNLVFDLTGRTLSIDQVSLHFTTLQHRFDPVRIGCHNPPIQYYPLVNCSDIETRYAVDTSILDDFSAENYGFMILDLENPQGIIPAGGTVLLKFVFNPMEEKDYEIELPISIHSEDTYFIRFYGKGIKDTEYNCLKDMTESIDIHPGAITKLPHLVPPIQTISHPNQLVRFSSNCIYLGVIPTFSSHKRLIIINNERQNEGMHFKWNTTLPVSERGQTSVVSIQPSQGYIMPGQNIICQMNYHAGSVTELLNCDIVCTIMSESERSHQELKEQEFENHITNLNDTDLNSRTSGQYLKRPRISVVERSLRESTMQSLNFISYRSNSDYNNEYIMNTNPTSYNHSKPQAPFIHEKIHIKANIIDIEEYKDQFPESYSQQSLPQIQKFKSLITHNSNIEKSPVLQSEGLELAFFSDIFENLLQDIIQHKSVEQVVSQVSEIRIPYYEEFADLKLNSHTEFQEEFSSEEEGSEVKLIPGSDSHEEIVAHDTQNVSDYDEDNQSFNDEKSESSHLGSIDLNNFTSHSKPKPVLDFQNNFEEEKLKQYNYEIGLKEISSEKDVPETLLLPSNSIQAPSDQNPEEISEDSMIKDNFQELLGWVLDEALTSICTELMEV